MRVQHDFAWAGEAIDHFSSEAKGNAKYNRARLVLYDEVKGDLPKK